MNIFKYPRTRSAFGLMAALAISLSAHAQTATWNNGAADNNWNTAGNWDIGTPAEGTNAVISGGFTVNYSAPMVAGSFNGFTTTSPINVSAAGFVSSGSGIVSGTAAKFNVNGGGVVAVTNGSLTFTARSAGSLAAGGTLSLQSQLNMGASGAANDGFFTNSGGMLSAASTRINPNNLSTSSSMIIAGGTNDLGNVTINRSQASSFLAIGAEGLVISNGLVRMTTLGVGGTSANSHLSCVLVNGTVTNTGSFIINQATSGRAARFLQLGGLFVSSDPIGVRVAITNAGSVGIYAVLGGTNIAERFVLGDLTNNSGTVNFTNAAKIYVGSGGMVSNLIQNVNVALNSGGTFGANADWASAVSIILAGGSFAAEGLDATPHNISLNNVVRGNGQLIKSGGGALILNTANTYSGNTVVNQGRLALGASGTTGSSPQVSVASGATFDVSGVAGYTLAASRTLTGSGSVTGNVAVASGGIINPAETTGALTFANSLTETGGAINHFDLPTTPGPGNDKVIVSGDLNASGVNTLEVVGGGTPGTHHVLIQYGGNFVGTLANFAVTGATGNLTNDTVNKTIGLTIASAIRNPTNVVWVGNGSLNDWDTVNVTNWMHTGTSALTYFVAGDNVLFNNTGSANGNVNIVGNNAPGTLTVGASGNYTFGGAGNISGSTGLTKTNTGTLTIASAHSYSGATTISGGVLDAAVIAIGGANSSIGSSSSDPSNLILDAGTLRYSGATTTTDRGATLNSGGGVVTVSSGAATLSVGGAVGGAGALTKSGAGTLALGAAGTYSGGTIINSGTLSLGAATSAGTSGITNNASTLRINGALTVENIVEFNGACTVDAANAGGNTTLRGATIGSGYVTILNVQNSTRTFTFGGSGAGGGHMWDFSGTIDFGTNNGSLRINNDNSTFNFGSSNATFNVGTGTAGLNQRNGGTTTHFGALIGSPTSTLSGRGGTGASGTTTYSIGGKNVDCTFAGSINNGSGTTAITKVGSAKLTLSGTGTHTGATSVESGTLQVDGNYGNSAVTVLSGAKLQGNGSLGGTVDIQAGATLSPGASIGVLGGIGSATLAGTTFIELDKANSTNDMFVATAGLNYGGDLIVTNLGGTLVVGDAFKIFDSTAYSGVFNTLTLPTIPAGAIWNLDNLAVDGTIRITGPTLNVVNNGTSLDFSWTGTYKLQSQTNNVTTGLGNNWFNYPGGGSSPVTVGINPANPAVFFRLSTP